MNNSDIVITVHDLHEINLSYFLPSSKKLSYLYLDFQLASIALRETPGRRVLIPTDALLTFPLLFYILKIELLKLKLNSDQTCHNLSETESAFCRVINNTEGLSTFSNF